MAGATYRYRLMADAGKPLVLGAVSLRVPDSNHARLTVKPGQCKPYAISRAPSLLQEPLRARSLKIVNRTLKGGSLLEPPRA